MLIELLALTPSTLSTGAANKMEIVTILAAAKASLELAKAGIEIRDEIKVKNAIAELNDKLFDLSMANVSTAQTISELQATISRLKTEKTELETKLKERMAYELYEVSSGAFCYRFQPTSGSSDPVHYLCQVCYDKGIKSVLQKKTQIADGKNKTIIFVYWHCSCCQVSLPDNSSKII